MPDRWVLPEALRDDTGVIFASVFPGFDSFADEWRGTTPTTSAASRWRCLEDLRGRVVETNGHSALGREIDRHLAGLREASNRSHTSSTAAFSSVCFRWGIRNSPN